MGVLMNKGYLKQQKEYLFDILSKEIKDSRVLKAIRGVPREEFVFKELRELAYINAPQDIGYDQTISQPYIVALMCELLELKDRDVVLDIGTGSGYMAAVLSKLCKEVVSIEVVPQLVKESRLRLKRLGYKNVTVIEGDGNRGYVKRAPYDKIVCSAVAKDVPNSWREQIVMGGLIVVPLYRGGSQQLVRVRYMEDRYFEEYFGGVVFVPLVD